MGIDVTPVADLEKINKYNKPTILSFGSIRPMKRTDQIIKAFELTKKEIPHLQLIIAGDTSNTYGRKVLKKIENSCYRHSIEYLGRVDQDKKIELMQKSHIICVASIKEGWGLVVTEANSQGTPAVVYNIDGLRDSVMDNETGIICQQNTPEDLAKNIIYLVNDKDKYQTLRKNAWEWSKKINFEKSYKDFISVLEKT